MMAEMDRLGGELEFGEICSKGRLIGLIPVQRKDLMLASPGE